MKKATEWEIDAALKVVLEAVLSMPHKGVTTPSVITSSLVMVALPLLEATTSRAAIAIWLQELADAYDEEGEEGLGEDPEEAPDDDEDGADGEWDEEAVELDPADDEPDPDDEPAHEPER